MPGPFAVVAGAVANKPFNGGEAWVRMSWVRGLARLGCRVAFVEEIAPDACVDAAGGRVPVEDSVNRRWFSDVVRAFGLEEVSALCSAGRTVSGLSREDLDDLLHEADVLVNVSGNLTTPALRDAARRRVYLDLDPGFTQLWSEAGPHRRQLHAHDAHVTVGANVGTDRCGIPTNGVTWHHVLPPVVLEDWPAVRARPRPRSDDGPVAEEPTVGTRFTTVATWRGPYGPVEWAGKTLGSKVHEFRSFVSLPTRVEGTFELALAIDPGERADRDLLANHGWSVVDPVRAAGTPAAFRRFVQESQAEFSVAQEMYVATRSGWFSDRSTRYLASGRPVLIQDTGFSRLLPVGTGLVPFTTMADAVSGARRILEDYGAHAQAARTLAEECFDSDRVLSGFLERVGIP